MNKKFAGRRNKNEKEKQDVGNDISRNKLQGITRRSKENFYRSNFRVVARVLSHRGGVKSPGVVSRRLVKASLRANTCVFTPSDVSRRLWTSSRGSQGRNNWNNHPLIPRLLPLLDRETESTLPLEPGTRQRYHSLLPSSHPPPPFFLLSVSRRVLTSPLPCHSFRRFHDIRVWNLAANSSVSDSTLSPLSSSFLCEFLGSR